MTIQIKTTNIEKGPSLLVRELRKRPVGSDPISIDMAWVKNAACAGMDPSVFFPEDGVGVREAKVFCQGCEVWQECLEYALLNRITNGVWGGTSERQRARILKERKDAQVSSA